MTLIVEDGTGLTTAESYLSEADADIYHINLTGSTDWSGATTAVKEIALRVATQYLDAVYKLRWLGDRTNLTQRLDWPRADIVDSDGFAIPSDDLPRALEEATAEMALRYITETDGILPDLSDVGSIKREMVKVGPITEDITYSGGKSLYKQFSIVTKLLSGLLFSVTRIERG